MTDREKLIELLLVALIDIDLDSYYPWLDDEPAVKIADHLIANGVTVQKHGRWIEEDAD